MKGKVILTGGTGFIGSHLLNKLLEKGYEVSLILRETSETSQLPAGVSVFKYSKKVDPLVDFLKKQKPSWVIHLASCFRAEHKAHEITELVESNILFGAHLLEAMSLNEVPYFINTGTSWEHFENCEYNPVCLYAATKKAFDDIIEFYYQSTPLKALTLKLFDTYGEKDPRGKLLSYLTNTLKAHQKIETSEGKQLMNLVHVDDVISSYFKAMEFLTSQDKEASLPQFAVSAVETIPLKDLILTYKSLFQSQSEINFGKRAYRKREVFDPWTNFRTLPHWSPLISLKDGLNRLKNEALQKK